MSKHSKNILNNWKLWVAVLAIVGLIACISIFALRNKLTAEETVSKFMYLIENKQYEKAKKLCSGNIEKLELLSNIKPANLNFKYSEDKKNATTILFEDEETAEMTTMNIELNNSLLGWKIKNYIVNTDYIPQTVLQARLENNQEISQSEFFLWAIYEETKAEDISKYAEDNLVVLTLFAQLMKEQKYDKAMKLYKPINSELGNGRELSEHEIKEFDWSNYNIYNSTGFFGINTYMINNHDKKINVMVNVDHTICHIYETNI